MKMKALLAGFMAMSLAFSSAVVPVRAEVSARNVVQSRRMVAEATDTKLRVEGMYGEYLHFTIYRLDGTGQREGSLFEKFIPVSADGYVTLPISDGKIVFSDMDAYEQSIVARADSDKLVYGFDLMDILDGYDEKTDEEIWINIPNDRYTANDYEFVFSGENKLRGDTEFQIVDGKFQEWDKNKEKLTGNILDKIIVKKVKEYTHTSVDFPEFKVQYEDGSVVEDGVEFLLQETGKEQHGVKVKDGMIKPNIKVTSNTLCSIRIPENDRNYNLADIVGANSVTNKGINVFINESGKAYVMKNIDDFEYTGDSFNTLTFRKLSGSSLQSGSVIPNKDSQSEDGALDIADEKTALGDASGAAVKGKRIVFGKDVKVADIDVVFEDGTKVPDGVVLDSFRMRDIHAAPAHYKVKDGKISGIVLKADEQYKIGFDVKNVDYNNYEVVGAYKSKKLLRVYARYEGGVLLKYDYEGGIEAPEEEISKIVVKKTDGKPSELPKSTSCLMILILSDNGYQPEGILPFRLVRKDSKKSALVYSSEDGLISLNGEAGVDYEIKLDKNPLYKLKKKIEFRFMLDSKGKYQPVIKGYTNPDNLEGRLTCYYLDLVRLDGKKPVGPTLDSGECTTCQKYTLKDYKEIYNTKKIAVKDLPVKVKSASLNKDIKFEVYNATKQKVEKTLVAKNGKLAGLKLVQGNDYIISAMDKEYSMKNAYVTLSRDGKKLVKSKAPYGDFKGFDLKKRAKALKDEAQANRVAYKLPVYVLGDNKAKIKNTRLKFISTRETVEADVVDGWVDLSLLEDTNYVVEVAKGNYAIDSFPMTIKDKSEYGAKKYVFNHLSCGSVQALYLIDKKMAHKNDTVLLSGDGTTSATGFRFGNGEYALSARVLKNVKVPELKDNKYIVLDVDTVNMYRVELSPLAHGQFKITTTLAGDKAVKNVYYVDDNNKLHKVKFTQKGDKLTYNMSSMARYNNVIEYK